MSGQENLESDSQGLVIRFNVNRTDEKCCHLCREKDSTRLFTFTGLRNFGGWTCFCVTCGEDIGIVQASTYKKLAESKSHRVVVEGEDIRTVSQVLEDRKRPGVGCCDDYADRKACDCLARARDRGNGGVPAGNRQFRKGIDGCPICGNPHCPDYGQKH